MLWQNANKLTTLIYELYFLGTILLTFRYSYCVLLPLYQLVWTGPCLIIRIIPFIPHAYNGVYSGYGTYL